MTRSGFYAWTIRPASAHTLTDLRLRVKVRTFFQASRQRYGSPRIHRDLFEDGERVYIQFPAGIAQGELPPLFVVGTTGKAELVNYRYRAPYYVVDRLFSVAELRLGSDPPQVVKINRSEEARQ